jgi:hypothetical protein
MRETKVLKTAPSLAGYEFTAPVPKHISTRSFEMGFVVLSVGDPGKDLVGNNFLAQLSNFRLDFRCYMIREKYYMGLAESQISKRHARLTLEASLECCIVVYLVIQNRRFLEEAFICT